MERSLPIILTESDSSALTRFREEQGIIKPGLEDVLFLPEELRLVAGLKQYSEKMRNELLDLLVEATSAQSQYRRRLIEEIKAYLGSHTKSKERYATPEEIHNTLRGRLRHRLLAHKEPVIEETIKINEIDRDHSERVSKQFYDELRIHEFGVHRKEILHKYPPIDDFKIKLDSAIEEAKKAVFHYFPVFQSTNEGQIDWEIVKASMSSTGFGYSFGCSFEKGQVQHSSESKSPSLLISLVAPEHAGLLTDMVFNVIANAKRSLNESNSVMKNQNVVENELPIDLETKLHIYNNQAAHFHKNIDPRVGFFFAYAAATLAEIKKFVDLATAGRREHYRDMWCDYYKTKGEELRWSQIGLISARNILYASHLLWHVIPSGFKFNNEENVYTKITPKHK